MKAPRPLLYLAVLLIVAAFAPSSRADFITGFVVDANGVGIEGVDIDVKNLGSGGTPDIFNDGTDATGFFFTTVPNGTYRVTFNPPPPPASVSFVKEIEPVSILGTKDMGTIVLDGGVALTGRAVTASGVPVAGINIDIIAPDGTNMLLVGDNTNAAGHFALAVPLGDIEVRFDTTPVAGPLLASEHVFVATSAALDLGDVVFHPGFVMTAVLRTPSGTALANVDTVTSDAVTGEVRYTPADKSSGVGLVQVVVPAGSFDFQTCPLTGSQLVSKLVQGIAVTGATNLGVLTHQAGKILTGVVRDSTLAPVGGVDVDVVDLSTGLEVPLCDDNSFANGSYSVVVPVGTHEVQFKPPYAKPYASLVVNPVTVSATTTLNVTLPDCPFHTPYGSGLAGTGGLVPLMATSGGTPRLGNAGYALEMSNGRGGATAAFLLGLAPASIPFKLGHLLIDVTLPYVVFFVPLPGTPGGAGQGTLTIPLPISDDPLLVGLAVYDQFLVQDPSAPVGWAMSNGIEVAFCD